MRYIDLEGMEKKQEPSTLKQSDGNYTTAVDNTNSSQVINRVELNNSMIQGQIYLAWQESQDHMRLMQQPGPQFSSTDIRGSKQYKMQTTMVEYMPGPVGDAVDVGHVYENLTQGNYKMAAFHAIFLIPFTDYVKPLKLLKGAGKIGGSACMDFASDFMKNYGKALKKAGNDVKKFEIDIGSNGLIGTFYQQLANTGKHQYIQVVKDGKEYIFDNLHPEGILKDDYIKIIEGYNPSSGGVISAEKLFGEFSKVIE